MAVSNHVKGVYVHNVSKKLNIHKAKLRSFCRPLTADDGSEDVVGTSDADGDTLGSCEMLGATEGDADGSPVGAVDGTIVGLLDVDGFNDECEGCVSMLVNFNYVKIFKQ